MKEKPMQQAEIAQVIKTLSTGIYGIGVHRAGEPWIFTASWVMPVSFDPVLIAVSVNPNHRSYPMMKQGGCFSINVIDQGHGDLAAKLAGPGDRLQGLDWVEGITHCPLLDSALAQIECRVIEDYPAGDHRLIVGKVIQGQQINPEGTPLLYTDTGDLDGAISLFPERLTP